MPYKITADNINGGTETSIEVEGSKITLQNISYKDQSAQIDQTIGYSPELIDVIKRVDLLERQIKTTQTGSLEKLEEETIGTERVSPEILYGDESLVMIKAREVMKQGLSHLSDALISYNEELERENYIDLFWNSILELQYFLIRTPIDDNLEEGITMFQVALYNHRTMPMKRDEVVALKIVFEKFMNNIKLSKALLDECLDKIEEAGFDLSGPLAKIEGLHELE